MLKGISKRGISLIISFSTYDPMSEHNKNDMLNIFTSLCKNQLETSDEYHAQEIKQNENVSSVQKTNLNSVLIHYCQFN